MSNKLISVDNGGDTGFTNLKGAFSGCSNLTSIPNNSSWTKDVTDMSYMLKDASSFNQPINIWDISNVTDMSYMFCGADSFDQSLSDWDTSNVDNMTNMFCTNSILSTSNYDSMLNSWSSLPVKNNIRLDVGNTKYTLESVSSRYILTNTYYWIINDGGLYMPFQLLYTLDNPNASGKDYYKLFGDKISSSDLYFAVGEPNTMTSAGEYESSVYIYNADGSLFRTIVPSKLYNGNFGNSIAITDNICIITEAASGGCAHIFDISTGNILRTLYNPNVFGTTINDRFGSDMDISGSRCVISDTGETDATGVYTNSGVVHIFDIDTGNLLHTFVNPNTAGTSQTDYFGYSVAINENYCVVGTPYEDTTYADDGKVFIYDNITGDLVYTLSNPDRVDYSVSDFFGYDVSINDTHCLIGCPNDHDVDLDSGTAYMFDLNTGLLTRTIPNPNVYGTKAYDQFSLPVSLSNNYYAISAIQEDDINGLNSGVLYIYDFSTGDLLHTIVNPNTFGTSPYDRFSSVTSITDTYCVVGAYGSESYEGGDKYAGIVYTIDLSAGSITNTLTSTNPYGISEYDLFGASLNMSASYTIVGAPKSDNYNDTTGYEWGRAYLFNNSTGLLKYVLNAPNTSDSGLNSYLGCAVSTSENYSVVGAYFESYIGKAFIFDNNTGDLLHTLENPDGIIDWLQFGYSVSHTDTYCVVGCPYYNSGAGKVYVFDTVTGAHLLTLINPDNVAPNDYNSFGNSVSIFGNKCVIGCRDEIDGVNENAGKAFIFDVTTGDLLHTLINPNIDGDSWADEFGTSVGIYNDYCIIGSPGESVTPDYQVGKAYIFSVDTGELVTTISNPPSPELDNWDDYFGTSVDISTTYCIVGSPYDRDNPDNPGELLLGRAYIFDIISGALVKIIENPNPFPEEDWRDDMFGVSVGIYENTINNDVYCGVGAKFEGDALGEDSGKAYIFK